MAEKFRHTAFIIVDMADRVAEHATAVVYFSRQGNSALATHHLAKRPDAQQLTTTCLRHALNETQAKIKARLSLWSDLMHHGLA